MSFHHVVRDATRGVFPVAAPVPRLWHRAAPIRVGVAVGAIWLVVAGAAGAQRAPVTAKSGPPATARSVNPSAVIGALPRPTGLPGESWPQRFDFLGGEAASFAFIASQPGPITVSVQSQGSPITLSLSGPVARPIEQSGSGAVTLAYTATAADVARSSIWLVRLRQQGTPNTATAQPVVVEQSLTRAAATARLTPVSSGMITVAHPPGDINIAKAALAARPATAVAVQPSFTGQQFLDQRKAVYMQARAVAQNAQVPRLALLRAASQNTSAVTRPQITRSADVAPRGPAVGVGGSGGGSVVTPPGVPTIDSLNIARGQPGDWMIVYGPFVDDCQTQIHFVIGPTTDVAVNYAESGYFLCTTANIPGVAAQVPNVSGLMPYDGQIYVVHAGHKSRAIPFHFDPGIGFAQLAPLCNDPGAQIGSSDLDCPVDYVSSPLLGMYDPGDWGRMAIVRVSWNDPFGHRGEDTFYSGKVLKNGWLVDSVVITCGPDYTYPGSGVVVNFFPCTQAYVLVSGAGTPSPFVVVHWWLDAFSSMRYKVLVNIKGPQGVTYQ
jgi:hypothetical protein